MEGINPIIKDCKDTYRNCRKMKSFFVVFAASLVTCAFGGISVPSGSYIPTSGIRTHSIHQGSGTYPTYGTGIYNAEGLSSLQTPIHYGGVYHGSDYHHMTYGSGEKQVYYFDAPHDFEATKLRVRVQPTGHSQERVIFIKAPVYRAPEITFHQPAPQPAERTRVYVLVKKPEEHREIVVPAAPRAAPLRPDVVFVNYRTQQEAEQQIRNIQGGASSSSSSGVIAKSVGSHTDLVSSINDYGSTGIGGSGSGYYNNNNGGNSGYTDHHYGIIGNGGSGYTGNEGYTGQHGYTGHHGYTGNGYSGNGANTGYYGKQVQYGQIGSSGPY